MSHGSTRSTPLQHRIARFSCAAGPILIGFLYSPESKLWVIHASKTRFKMAAKSTTTRALISASPGTELTLLATADFAPLIAEWHAVLDSTRVARAQTSGVSGTTTKTFQDKPDDGGAGYSGQPRRSLQYRVATGE
jgi:hypothetical protein